MRIQIRPQQPIDQLIDALTLPPSVHVCFTETKCPLRENTVDPPIVPHGYIPRTDAVESNVSGIQEGLEGGGKGAHAKDAVYRNCPHYHTSDLHRPSYDKNIVLTK